MQAAAPTASEAREAMKEKVITDLRTPSCISSEGSASLQSLLMDHRSAVLGQNLTKYLFGCHFG